MRVLGPSSAIPDDARGAALAWRQVVMSPDGSLLAVYVRGVEGFMFSPSYKTALRVDFVGGKIAEASRIETPPRIRLTM